MVHKSYSTGFGSVPNSTPKDNAPDDSDNDFLCAVQLQRIANSLETIIKMVKKDQEAADAYRRQQNDQKD